MHIKGSTVIPRLFRSPVGLVSFGPKMIQSFRQWFSNSDHPWEATHGVGEPGTGSQPAIVKQYTYSLARGHCVVYIDCISTHNLLQYSHWNNNTYYYHHHHYGFELFLCERSVTEFYLLQSAQTGTGAHTASCSVATGVYLPDVKWWRRVVDHPPQSSAEVKS